MPMLPRARSLIVALCAFLTLMTASACPMVGDAQAPSLKAQGPCDPGASKGPQGMPSACSCGEMDIPLVGEPFPFAKGDQTPKRGGELVGHVYSNLPSLMYLLNSDALLWYITVPQVYEALVLQDPRDYEIRPALATHWEVAEDGLTWTFHLREGVTWHDGEPFSAEDVIFTFDTIMNPQNRTEHIRSTYQNILDPVRGYEALDDNTVVLHLKDPIFTFTQELANTIIIPKHVFGRGDFNSHPNIRAPVGTGPFSFVSWTSDAIKFTRFEDYWGPKAYLEDLTFRVVTDFETAFLMLQRGDIDFMTRLRPHQRSEGITDAVRRDFNLTEFFVSAYAYMVYNTEKPVFADARARRAMSYIMPTDRIICEIYQCLGARTTGPLPMTHPAYDHTLKPYPYDPDKAAALLKDAGWSDSDGDGVLDKMIDGVKTPFRFTFLLSASSRTMEQQITIIQSAAQRIGVDIQISKVDWSVYVQSLREGEYEAAGLRWIMSHENDPYNLFHSEGPQNYPKWKHEEADKLLQSARYMDDSALRNILYRRFHGIIHEEQPYSFIFAPVLSGLARKNIGGIYSSDNFYQWNELFINDPTLPDVPPAERFPGSPGAPAWSQYGEGRVSP